LGRDDRRPRADDGGIAGKTPCMRLSLIFLEVMNRADSIPKSDAAFDRFFKSLCNSS
jgi:hypothetical protein